MDLYAEVFPTIIDSLTKQCKSGLVSADIAEPWFIVITEFAKDTALASKLGSPATVLKTSCANLLSFVKHLVHTREILREFSNHRTASDDVAMRRTLLVLQAAVVQLQKQYDTASYGKIENDICASAAENLRTLSKVLLEGNETLKGMNAILAAAGRETEQKSLSTLKEKLNALEVVSGGLSEGKSWSDGLLAKASWAQVFERAEATLLAQTKDFQNQANTALTEAIEVPMAKGATSCEASLQTHHVNALFFCNCQFDFQLGFGIPSLGL
jgi:hypothetical protein